MVMVEINEPIEERKPAANFPWEDREAWSLEGLCLGLGKKADKIFFPEQGGNTKEAKCLCARCPVRTQCLEYALRRGEKFGIWGGKTEKERRKMRREQRLQEAG